MTLAEISPHAGRLEAGPHVAVVERELADGLTAIPGHDEHGRRYTGVHLLVRLFGEPLGVLELAIGAGGLDAVDLAVAVETELGALVAERVRACGLPWFGVVSSDGLRPAVEPPFQVARARARAAGPSITVAICTRDRPDGLARMLESLVEQRYPVRTLIVDNAPSDDRSERVAERFATRLDVRYVREERPGLSWARNRSIDESDTDVIAWVDDDEVCDPWWAAEIARGFVEHPEAGAVSGAVLPAEIETPAQARFEEYGGHSKGRGLTPAVFSPATRSQQSPLYPLPPFGVGGNMAFRREAIERIGRFDCALGAGTLTQGAEDTAALSLLLFLGGTVVYQPAALIRHWHRRDDAALERLFEGYGCGLGAFYTSVVLRHPTAIVELIRLAPRALHDLRSRNGARLGGLDEDFPAELLALNRAGMRRGPLRYLQARRIARRIGRGSAS
jgi:glycosyltransferase involved in cell wall biosynthesis